MPSKSQQIDIPKNGVLHMEISSIKRDRKNMTLDDNFKFQD